MRDDPITTHIETGREHPAASFLWAYAWCIAAALAAGLLFDRMGAARTAVVLGALAVALLGMRNFRVFAALVVFMLPFVPTYFLSQQVAGLSGQRIIGMAIAVTAASLFVAAALKPGQLRLPRWRPVFLAFLAVFVGASFNGARHADTIPDYFKALGVITDTGAGPYLQNMLFAPMLVVIAAGVMALLAANVRRPGWIRIPIFASAVVLAGVVCMYAAGASATVNELAQQESRRTLSKLGLHANEIGLLLNMALALALCSLGEARTRRERLALGAASLVLIAGIVMTFSRGAFLGMVVVVVYAFAGYRRKAWAMLLLGGLVLAAATMSDAIVGRILHGIGGNDLDLISSGRVDQIWRPLIPELARHPLLGNGHASILWSEAAQSRAILPVGHPHSAYLASLLDVGIVGSLVTVLFFGHMWRLMRRLAREHPLHGLRGFFRGGAACIPLLCVQGLTDDSFMPGFTHAYLWLAYGAAVGAAAALPAGRAGSRIAKNDRLSKE